MKKTLVLWPLLGALALAPDDGDEITQEELEALTETIRAEIAELRHQEFPRPVEVAIASDEEFRQYVDAQLEKEASPEELAAQEDLAKLLGLIPADMDYLGAIMALLEEQVGGFYDPDEEAFYLMSRFGGDVAKVILAHELTHALDDQLYDIDGKAQARKDNGDAGFAFHAVVEGSGTAVMNTWTIKNLFKLNHEELLEAQSMGADALEEALPYIWKPLMGAYLRGNAFLNRTTNVIAGSMKMPELEDFERAFTEPPRSSEQILHPEKYWDPEEADEPVPVAIETGGLPEGWRVLEEDTLGELGLGLLIEPLDARKGVKGPMGPIEVVYTYEASEGWGGDRLVLLGKGSARVLLLVTAWDSEADADEFRAAVDGLSDHFDEAVAGTARALRVRGAGWGVAPGRTAREVRVECWAGVDDVRARRVLDDLDVQIDWE